MRRQIVIMLLGLMTTLSLPAFAIAGSRESSHATQPYKYIGKELDRTHGLDWQTIGDSVRSYRYQYNRLICEVIGDAIYIIINLAAATQGKDVAHQVVAVLRDISV